MNYRFLLCLCALALHGCSGFPFWAANDVYEPAKIIDISAPKSISLGATAIITATVYAGPNGCYKVEQLNAAVDERRQTILVDAVSRRPSGNNACPQEDAVEKASAEFTPVATGTYLVEANRFFAGYAPGTASATATIVVLP